MRKKKDGGEINGGGGGRDVVDVPVCGHGGVVVNPGIWCEIGDVNYSTMRRNKSCMLVRSSKI